MSLEYGTLEHKSLVDYKLGKASLRVQDLLTKTFNDDIDFYSNYTLIEVTKEYIGRPDLISYALYHDDMYADILCKINGVSNPFELNEGMVLVCPSENFINRFNKLENSTLDGFAEDTDTLQKKYKTFKKQKNEKRSPNEATIFDHKYTKIEGTNLLVY